MTLWEIKRRIRSIIFMIVVKMIGRDVIYSSTLFKKLFRVYRTILKACSIGTYQRKKFIRDNPDAPWFVPKSIPYIESVLKPEFRVFEYGSGKSTIWFAKRVKHITSVEARTKWADKVLDQIYKEKLDNVCLLFSEVTAEYNFKQEERDKYARQIRTQHDKSLDVVVIDGHFRKECMYECLSKIKDGGYLIIDNSDEEMYDNLKQKYTDHICFRLAMSETTVFRITEAENE